jgi:hypothetical protein
MVVKATIPLDEATCADCVFWEKDGMHAGGTIGFCRRHAPQPSTFPAGRGIWPITKDLDWCGEFANEDAPRTEMP